MRDRLIELLDECRGIEGIGTELVEKQADHLLAEGVIVPPCKVGQTVYFVYETDNETMCIDKGEIESFSFDDNGVWFRATYEHLSSYWHTALSIGYTVFLTREEAEKALERREG